MDATTRMTFDNLRSEDGDVRYAALMEIMRMTDEPVDWAYEVWDELLERLRDKNNHQRAIASTLLCNLARSDPQRRMLKDFDAVLAVTYDERFVTARHTLQALWKVAAAGPEQQRLVVERLAERFRGSSGEKNYKLIRYDILEGLRQLYDQGRDATVRETALALIELEQEPKYRSKYATLWRRA
jgi:hypothetical protein